MTTTPDTLRGQLIRLAKANPELRKDLLPILAASKPSKSDLSEAKRLFDQLRDYDGEDMALDDDELDDLWDQLKGGDTTLKEIRDNLPEGFREKRGSDFTASHDVEAASYQDYLEKKKKQGKPPMEKDEWEVRTNGGTQGGSTPKKDAPKKEEPKKEEPAKKEKDTTPTKVDKKLGDILSQWHSSASDPIYQVSSSAAGGHGVPKHVAEAAHDKLTMMIENASAYRYSDADVKELTKAKKLLEKSVGGAKKDAPKKEEPKKEEPKKEEPKKEEPKKEEPKKTPERNKKEDTKSYKKTYKPSVAKVMDKHSLTDDDAAEVKKFKKDKPSAGAPVSDAVLMQRFMAKAKPETKERMKGMSPKEFMAMLAAISDEEGGKTASLRGQLIRLAQANPELRKDILPLLTACDHTEAPMMGKYEEGQPADPTENMSEEDKKEWELNTLKHKDNFKSASDLRSRLVRLAHENPALRKDILPLLKSATEEKTAGMAVVRKSIAIAVRVLSHSMSADGKINLTGQMSLDFGGNISPDAIRFTASVSIVRQSFVVTEFNTAKAVSGAGAAILENILRSALMEALEQKGGALIGQTDQEITIPAY